VAGKYFNNSRMATKPPDDAPIATIGNEREALAVDFGSETFEIAFFAICA
jgi:hypothetical protein